MSDRNSALDIIPDIGRSRTRDTIQEVLEDLIIHAKLKVGERFPSEAKLAKAFGVSRVMVREAMKVLEAHGLVDIVQGKGIIVKEPDLSSAADALSLLLQRKKATITDLWEARAALEAAVVVHACGRASQEQLQALSETAAQWSESVSDLDELLAADERFHRMLVEAACNPVLTLLMETIWDLLHESRRVILELGPSDFSGHSTVAKALLKRDPDAAREAMLAHLQHFREDLLHAGVLP